MQAAPKRLLQDVEQNKVKVIVVYRLNPAHQEPGGFAKIVEALDARSVFCFRNRAV